MLNFLFVCATARPWLKRNYLPLFKSFDRIAVPVGYTVASTIAYENHDGLPTVYNRAIEKNPDFDFYVFLHDDIWVNDCFILDKLVDASKQGDLIGVCGGKGWQPPTDPNKSHIWTHAAGPHGMSGFMLHHPNERTYFSSSYGVSPSPVLTLDGCFLCLTRDAVQKGVRFDEQFRFHFYDMDVCMTAYSHQFRNVTAPILLTHQSVGASVYNPEFLDAQKKFITKWFNA